MRKKILLVIKESSRFGYQGQFAEKDDETGYYAFQLRQYDSRIMRWLTPDPYGQYFSPYMSMGNSWVNRWDRDGGCDDDDCSHYGTTLPTVTIWGINGKKSPIVNAEVDEDWVNPRLVNSSFTGTLEEWNEKHGLPRNTNFQAAYQHYLQLKIDRETQEMIRSIHQGQANFVRNVYLLVAHEFNMIGEVSLYTAHATSYVPGLQPVSGVLYGIGTVSSLAGTGMNIGYYAKQGDYGKITLEAGTLGATILLRNRVSVGYSKGYLDDYVELILKSKVQAYFSGIKRIGNTAIDKKK